MKKNNLKHYVSHPNVGDILEDRNGNKMVVVDVVSREAGECYVLMNGRIKLVSAQSSWIIRSHKQSEELQKIKRRR